MELDHELREAERAFEAREDVETWSSLAVLAGRLGRLPEPLAVPRALDRLLETLGAAPNRRALAELLRFYLPFEVLPHAPPDLEDPWADSSTRARGADHEFHQERGLPLWVRLPAGQPLVLAPRGDHWWSPTPLDQGHLAREGFGQEHLEEAVSDRRSLDWYRAAEYAQALTDQAHEAGTLVPSWELSLPSHGGPRHLFPRDKQRLVLRKARRRRPAPPRIELEVPYTAIGSWGFRVAFFFRENGRLSFLSRPMEMGPLTPEAPMPHAGRWTLTGRRLELSVTTRPYSRDLTGFVASDGALAVVSTSRITGARNAVLLRRVRWG